MAERLARVVRAPDQTLQLQWTANQCQDCIGCGGRCALFPTAPPAAALLAGVDAPAEGALLAVRIDDVQLRRAAWLGYGLALVGLLMGAVAGHASALILGQDDWADVATLMGLTLGTAGGARLARRGSAPITEIVVTPSVYSTCNRKDPECP